MKKIIKYMVIFTLILSFVFGLIACKEIDSTPTFTVQFDAMYDGGGIEVQPQEVKHGGKVTKPPDLSRDEYEFEGWFVNTDFNEEDKWYFIGYVVTDNMTLYAKWVPLPTLWLDYQLIEEEGAYSVGMGVYAMEYTDIYIPALYKGLPVTRIRNNAFCDYSNITSITIPGSVTVIGDNAFKNCSGLKSIIISENVTYIGENVFEGCNLTVYAEPFSQPGEWDTNWNPDRCPVMFRSRLSVDGNYVINFFNKAGHIVNPNKDIIKAPYRKGYTFVGWGSLNNLTVSYTAADIWKAQESYLFETIWTVDRK